MEREVPVGGRTRPADLLAHWGPESEAIDVTIRHNAASFDSPNAADRVTSAAISKHVAYDSSCRLANLGFRVFGLSTFGGAAPEAMGIIGTLSSRLKERYGNKEGQRLTQQAVERIAVTSQRGVAAMLLSSGFGFGDFPESDHASPQADGGLVDSGFRAWQKWAREHGFEPAPPTGIAGSAGIRVLASAPAELAAPSQLVDEDPLDHDQPHGEAEGEAPLPAPRAGQDGRALFWEDKENGWRVWTRV